MTLSDISFIIVTLSWLTMLYLNYSLSNQLKSARSRVMELQELLMDTTTVKTR
jgi:hypothetical protein